MHKIFGTIVQAFSLYSLSFFSCIPSLLCPYPPLYLSCFLLQHEMSLYTVRQLSKSGSSFLNVMMNGDFWGFFLYFYHLSIIKCDCAR